MRFKELRGLFLGILLALLDSSVFIFAFISQDKLKMIVAFFLSVIILISLLTQFYIRVLSDCIFLYHFVGIALLPKIIELKDILNIELISNHHLLIHTSQGNSHIYVWNAQKLQQILMNQKEKIANETN